MSNELKAPANATKAKRVVGRGRGCTKGGTCGRGYNGQNSRSGGGVRPGFEGGQMPLFRRVARRGFLNYPFKKEYFVINVEVLQNKFEEGDTVSLETLRAKKMISKNTKLVKILSRGELSKKLTVDLPKVSAGAKEKIEAAGGTVSGQAAETADKSEETTKTEEG